MLKIEKNIPIQFKRVANNGNGISEMTITLKKMRVGDSVFLKDPKNRAKFFNHLKANSIEGKFITRIEGTGFRGWRIK